MRYVESVIKMERTMDFKTFEETIEILAYKAVESKSYQEDFFYWLTCVSKSELYNSRDRDKLIAFSESCATDCSPEEWLEKYDEFIEFADSDRAADASFDHIYQWMIDHTTGHIYSDSHKIISIISKRRKARRG